MTFNELLELDKQGGEKRLSSSPRKALPRPKAHKRPRTGTGAQEQETKVPQHRGVIAPALVEKLRKAVKQLGKEAATHRFTLEEKRKLADIIYTYARQGYRTSENELVRIGMNWLVEDYRENGKESVLHKVLKALKE